MNCKDDELNAKLYSNRAIAHLHLGESSKRICQSLRLSNIFLNSAIIIWNACPCSLTLHSQIPFKNFLLLFEETRSREQYLILLSLVFWFSCSAINDSMEPSKDTNLELVSAMSSVFSTTIEIVIQRCSLVSVNRLSL